MKVRTSVPKIPLPNLPPVHPRSALLSSRFLRPAIHVDVPLRPCATSREEDVLEDAHRLRGPKSPSRCPETGRNVPRHDRPTYREEAPRRSSFARHDRRRAESCTRPRTSRSRRARGTKSVPAAAFSPYLCVSFPLALLVREVEDFASGIIVIFVDGGRRFPIPPLLTDDYGGEGITLASRYNTRSAISKILKLHVAEKYRAPRRLASPYMRCVYALRESVTPRRKIYPRAVRSTTDLT